ncbi:hypothetical protein LCGC14_0808680 [marine sediment metagenome]|uniref:DUF2292 domain-containing protein n=1 Tax=marine sediment metagenome TaxID=412755 RepID=A0A0F9SUY1_9ZZZZ
MSQVDTNGKMELSEKEQKLIERLRTISFGEVTIVKQDGKLLRTVRATESELL